MVLFRLGGCLFYETSLPLTHQRHQSTSRSCFTEKKKRIPEANVRIQKHILSQCEVNFKDEITLKGPHLNLTSVSWLWF